MIWRDKLHKAAVEANKGDTEKLESLLMDKAEEGRFSDYVYWEDVGLSLDQIRMWAEVNKVVMTEVNHEDQSCYLSWVENSL